MDLVILGGNGSGNRLWLDEMEKLFREKFNTTFKIIYDHWQHEQPLINLIIEATKLENIINSKDTVIIAKSAGILVTLKDIYDHKINPTKCVFLGTPIKWASQNHFDLETWLKDYSIPTLFIQQENDPFGALSDLEKLLLVKKVKNFTLKMIPGNDHGYVDFEEIKKLCLQFIS